MDSFVPRFVRLSLVNILSNLMVPLAGLVDVAFLGHLPGLHNLAGVALATVLFNYLYWSFGFLRMATTGTTAQAVGRQDGDAVLLIGLRNAAMAIAIGTVLVLLQHPIRSLGFALLRAEPEVTQAGQAYYTALIWAAPATLLNFVLLGWLLGQEQGYRVLVLSAISNGSNVALNYWFIVQLGWESTGAGLATALSQCLMTLVGLGIIVRQVAWRQVRSLLPQFWDMAAFRHAFMLNGDILIRTFALVSTFSLFTTISSGLSTLVLATNTLLLQVVSFAAYFIDGIAFATESFAGQFFGQGDRDQLKMLLRWAGSMSLALGLLFALTFTILADRLFGLLTNHADVLAAVHRFVMWLFPVLGFGAIAYMLDGYFLGLTAGRILRNAALISTGIGFLPLAYLAWRWQSEQVLWGALTLFMATRSLTLGAAIPQTLVSLRGDKKNPQQRQG
jgi:multidrug resistance protein, MATE family